MKKKITRAIKRGGFFLLYYLSRSTHIIQFTDTEKEYLENLTFLLYLRNIYLCFCSYRTYLYTFENSVKIKSSLVTCKKKKEDRRKSY